MYSDPLFLPRKCTLTPFSIHVMNDDARFEKWNNWLTKIYNDVQGLLINRYVFREVQRIIRSNPQIQRQSAFYEWMKNVYNAAVVIGIRRQLDTDKNSISFVRLFQEILKNPKILSRERYIALYAGSRLPNSYVQRGFNKFSGAGQPHVNPDRIKADLSTLTQTAAEIRKYANKRIAHFDRSRFRNLPTDAEVDEALDYLEDLLKKYMALFRAEIYHRIVPTWQYDWKQIFRYPWIQ